MATYSKMKRSPVHSIATQQLQAPQGRAHVARDLADLANFKMRPQNFQPGPAPVQWTISSDGEKVWPQCGYPNRPWAS